MTEHRISAAARGDEGKGASRRLRRAGYIPAIVYGAQLDPQSIQLEHEKTWLASQNEWFYSAILDLDLDGQVQKVLLRDMQRHPWKQQIYHLDFQRISEHEAIRVSVPLHFLNQDQSPAGKTSGVVIGHELTEVEISCLPKDLPEYLEIDLAGMNVGDIVHLSEIRLPAGVEIPELRLGPSHDSAIATAKYVKEEVEEVVAAEEGETPAEVPVAKQEQSEGDKDK